MKCWQKGWVAANDGNISWRLSDDDVLCTPTGVSKGMLKMEHICTMESVELFAKMMYIAKGSGGSTHSRWTRLRFWAG